MELTGYLDFWFRDLPIVERIQHFQRLGIRRLDVWLWRERPDGRDLRRVQAARDDHQLDLRRRLRQPGGRHRPRPRAGAPGRESLEAAVKYEIPHLFIFSNQIDVSAKGEWIQQLNRDYTPGEMYANLLDGVEKVMKLVKQTKVQLWFEALNTFHIHGGVFVCTHDLAADVVRRFDDPQLRLSFDCYHQQRTAGNLIWGMEEYYGLYPTFHIGDCPTRQEPGTGEINFTNISKKLDELGYDGLIGLECYPSTTEEEALARIRKYLPAGEVDRRTSRQGNK